MHFLKILSKEEDAYFWTIYTGLSPTYMEHPVYVMYTYRKSTGGLIITHRGRLLLFLFIRLCLYDDNVRSRRFSLALSFSFFLSVLLGGEKRRREEEENDEKEEHMWRKLVWNVGVSWTLEL